MTKARGSNRRHPRHRLATALGLALGLWLGLAAFTVQAQPQAHQYTLPSQPLGTALNQLAVTADRQLLVPPELVRGRTAPALTGRYTVEEALKRLLAGSGLSYRITGSGVITIVAAPPERSRPRAKPIGDTGAVEEEVTELETITVTGTNIRGVENPSTPIIKLSRKDIQQSGVGTVEELIKLLPQNFDATSSTAQNSANPNGSDRNITAGTSIDLRGAGDGATLVLINGRRPAMSGAGSFFDVSSLPLGMIDRVDVQTDGASAIYGSDAVGGVVNFITQGGYEGAEASMRIGAAEGGREQMQARLGGGIEWGSGDLAVSGEYSYSDALKASKRDFIDQTSLINQDAVLFPEDEKWSLFGTANQALTDQLKISGFGLYTNRNVAQPVYNSAATSFFKQDTLFASGNLNYDLGSGWFADAYIDYGLAKSSQEGSNRPGVVTRSKSDQHAFEGKISGGLVPLPGGPLSLAIGGIYREEAFDVVSNATPQYKRHIAAGYVELIAPLIKNRSDSAILNDLQLSLAGRYEDYSDFGGTFNPKVGVFAKFVDSLAIRGTYSTAFRAPSLTDKFSPRSFLATRLPSSLLTAAPRPEQDPRLPAGNMSVGVLQGASVDLAAESAEILTLGMDLEPKSIDGLRLSGTYFDISYTGRVERRDLLPVFQQTAFTDFLFVNPGATFVDALLADVGTVTNSLPGGIPARDVQVVVDLTLRNVSARTIRGLDFAGSYERDTGSGSLSFGVNATYLLDYKLRLTRASPTLEQVDTIYNPVDFRARGNIAWSRDDWTGFVAVNYTDGYRDLQNRRIGSWTTVDFTLNYGALGASQGEGFLIGLSVLNLLDQDPPFAVTADGFNFDTASASPLGRYFSLSLTKRW